MKVPPPEFCVALHSKPYLCYPSQFSGSSCSSCWIPPVVKYQLGRAEVWLGDKVRGPWHAHVGNAWYSAGDYGNLMCRSITCPPFSFLSCQQRVSVSIYLSLFIYSSHVWTHSPIMHFLSFRTVLHMLLYARSRNTSQKHLKELHLG